MNTILIKHGSSAPSNGTLQNYELGYVDNGALYIGYNNQSVKLTDPRLLNLLDSNGYLDIPNLPAAASAQTKVLVANNNNVVYSRTPAQLLADIGALPATGGTISSNLTISGLLTANGCIVINNKSYGTANPNDAGITGTVGQLYFVLTE